MVDQPVATAQTIVVSRETTPGRLDVFLAHHTNLSRSQLQKHIKSGSITLNGKTVVPHHPAHPGDVIAIRLVDVEYHQEDLTSAPLIPTVIFEDDMYLVVNKPAGLVVHGGPGIHEPTLANWAAAHDPRIKEVGDHPEQRPGIVHRLDRDVSGLMVIAKSQAAYEDLKQQFQAHTITKEYIALTHGRVTDPSGRISFAIARKADKSGLMVARPGSQEGKEAETRFTVERYVKNLTLLRVRTLTGRGHQIRVHFKAIGHPLVGDPLYRIKKQKPMKVSAPRVFLHATRLGFTDLDGKQHQFESPLPTDLAQYLARIS